MHVKIYYAPVSVESRLLTWRNRAAAKMTDGGDSPSKAKYVFAQLYDKEEEEEDSDDESMMGEEGGGAKEGEKDEGNGEEGQTAEENRRTQFLLGLIDEHGNPTGVGNDVTGADSDDDDEDRKISARRFILG